jgi:hypothetical protein
MSYYFYLTVDTGGPEPACINDGENYTSNLARMWHEAGLSLRDLHGLSGRQAADRLTTAITELTANPDHYRQFDPANGWGDYAGGLAYLQRCRDLCEQHPKAVVLVSA